MQMNDMTWKERMLYICRLVGYGAIVLLCTISLLGVSGYQLTDINAIGGALAALCGVVLYMYIHTDSTDKRVKRQSFWMAMPVSLSLTVGNILREADASGNHVSISMLDGVYFVGIFLLSVMSMRLLLEWLKKQKDGRISFEMKNAGRKEFFLLALIMLICWLPYFLTFFPGIFGSDPLESIRQALGMEGWTNHHPILYTGYIKFFLTVFKDLIGINGALALMTLVQMIILAGCLSYCLVWLLRKNVSFGVVLFSFLFFTVNPVIGVFSVYATKDVLFSAVVLLFVLAIYDFVEYSDVLISDRKYCGKVLIITYFTLFLRNNGVFLIVGTILGLAFVYRKYMKKLGIWLLFVIVCMMLQKHVVFPVLQVEEGSFAESLSIPLQQIGQAMVDGPVMSKEEETYLNQLMPIERWSQVYQQGYTDTIKFDDTFDDAYLNEHKGELIKVWAGMLPKNFGSYVKGYLLQTVGYWDIHQTESLSAYGVIDNQLGVIQVDWVKQWTGISLQGMIEALILICRKLPILCYLTNMAVMMLVLWIVVNVCGFRKSRCGLCLLPLTLVWITIMIAAPAAVKFRYLFAIYLCWPIFMFMLSEQKGTR